MSLGVWAGYESFQATHVVRGSIVVLVICLNLNQEFGNKRAL